MISLKQIIINEKISYIHSCGIRLNDNPIGSINARFAGRGISIGRVKNENGEDVSDRLFVSRETVDFIETDY